MTPARFSPVPLAGLCASLCLAAAAAALCIPLQAAAAPKSAPLSVPSPGLSSALQLAPEVVLGTMEKVADWQLAHPTSYPLDDWTEAVGDAGFMALAGLSGNGNYSAAMRAAGEKNRWQLGPSMYHADDYAVGQMYAELYLHTRDPRMIAPMRAQFDHMLAFPRPGSLNWKTPGVQQRWAWCDSLFMGPPAWARLTAATGDQRYLDFAIQNWWITSDYLYDKEEQLYYRDSRFFGQREANGKKVFWGRGNGWVMGGLVRMLQYIPEQHPARARFVAQYRAMSERLLGLQQADGLWRSSLLDPATYTSRESSGTALYTYALAYGVNQGILPRDKFGQAIKRAWQALAGHVNADGKLVHVQPIGEDPRSFDPQSSDVFAVGGFLLAGSELYRMALLEEGAARVVTVSNTGQLRRAEEAVEVGDAGEVAVMDAQTSRILPSQALGQGLSQGQAPALLFQTDLAPGESRRFLLLPRSRLPAVPPVVSRAHARFVPERLDDFAWENDRVAHRTYGPAIIKDPKELLVSSGIDVWSKSAHKLVQDAWYRSGDYHKDKGEGLDYYHVGKTRGCGGLGIYDGKTLHNSSNYSAWKILADGPLRTVFELNYDAWDAAGRLVAETRRISLDAGSNFSRVESRFSSPSAAPLTVGVGIVQRDGQGRYQQGDGSMSYWEPAAGENGSTACAVILPRASGYAVNAGHYLALAAAQPNQPFVYYMGATWSKGGDFADALAWEAHVAHTAARVAAPVKVTVAPAVSVSAGAAAAPEIHVDCSAAGPGAADGSLQRPLNSLDQLNAIRFLPGTRILFKRGATCHGSFQPRAGSSGTPGAPVVVDTYGDLALPRPAIAAGCRAARPDPQQALTEAAKRPEGVSPYFTLCTAGDGQFNRAALHLFNVEHWEINGLELSNDGLEEAGRVGLLVQLEDFGTGHHYRINDVYVHHVRGYLKDEPGRTLAYKATGGILFEVTRDGERPGARQKRTNFDDVLVANSEVYHVDGIGVSNRSAWMCRPRGAPCGDFPPYKGNPAYLKEMAAQAASEFFPSSRLVFRNNKIHDIGGDGLIVRTALAPMVEANLLYDIWMRSPGNSAGAWAINTDGAVFQYNEVHGVRLRPEVGAADGMAFDADMGTRDTRIYANYSHDNAGGLMLFCACGQDGLGRQAMVENVVVERNLSVDDRRRAILVAGLDSALVKDNLIVSSGATALFENHDYGTANVLEMRGNRLVDTRNGGALYRTYGTPGSYARFAWRDNAFHGYLASAESGAALPAAAVDAKSLIEQWFTATGFRQRGYTPRGG